MCSITWLFFFPLQVWEGCGWMCLRPVYEWRLLSQLHEQLWVCVWYELLRDILPNGRQRLLLVCFLGSVAKPLPAGVLPRDPSRRWARNRVGFPGRRLDPLPVHYDCTGLNSVWMEGHSELHLNKCRRTKGRNWFLLLCLSIWMC